MNQNLVSHHLSAEEWTAVDAAITQLATVLQPALVALGKDRRRRLVKMGDGSEAFCRQSLDVARENASILPRNFDIEEVARDLEAHDALNTRIVRLQQVLEKMRDTETALGSDVMSASLEAYAYLKTSGKGEGVETLKKMLGRRFDNNGPRPDAGDPPSAPATASA